MKTKFDVMQNRRNTNSSKWDVEEGVLAMSIADMDFQTAPCVQHAIEDTAGFGIFGYSEIPEAYYESYQQWWKKYHHFTMKREWMLFSSGVIPALSSIIRRLTQPAENILVQAPVYNIFYNSIQNNGRNVISSDLVYEDGNYRIDFEDLDRKLGNPQTTMMILCNPHNPIGKIWTSDELFRIGALCRKHHVLVVSDEVHCDLSLPNKTYTPFASLNDAGAKQSITCLSASKAFNIAGLQAACIVIPNEAIRHKVQRGLHTDEVAEGNVFACVASIAALQAGKPWLEELKRYLDANRKTAAQYIEKNLPQFHLVDADATYLLWLDCSVFHPFVTQFCKYLYEKKKLKLSKGISFGKSGEDFLRINIACPQDVMMEGLKRLKEGFEAFSTVNSFE